MRKKDLRKLDKFEICQVLEKCGVINSNEMFHKIMYQFENIGNIFEQLREGNEMRLNDDVQMVLEIMKGRWGGSIKENRPGNFKVIKTIDDEGDTYVKIEWD